MAQKKKLAIDPILIVTSVVLMVVAGVQIAYFLIDSTVNHAYSIEAILDVFTDIQISWEWWLPLAFSVLCLLARRAVSKDGDD